MRETKKVSTKGSAYYLIGEWVLLSSIISPPSFSIFNGSPVSKRFAPQ